MFTLDETVNNDSEQITAEKKLAVIIHQIGMGIDINDEDRKFFLNYVYYVYLKGNKEVKKLKIAKNIFAKYAALFKTSKQITANDCLRFTNTLARILDMMYVKYQITEVLPTKGNLQAVANELDLFETYGSDLNKYSRENKPEEKQKIREKLMGTGRFTIIREARNNQ